MAKRVGRPRTKQKKRSRRSRVAKRARSIGRRIRSKATKHKKSIMATVITLVPALQSAQLLSQNQVAGAVGNTQKMKAIINGITGSIFDFNFFSDVPQAHFNPDFSGGINQWSITNLALIIGGSIAGHFKLKHASKVRNIGAISLVPSVLAGILGKNNTVKSSVFETFHNVASAPLTTTTTSTTNGGLA